MRLAEDKIKAAILDPDPAIRERAARYYAPSWPTDEAVTPLVIEGIQRFGRENSKLCVFFRHLPQSPESVEWVLSELSDATSLKDGYREQLARVFLDQSPESLLPWRDRIVAVPDVGPRIARRLDLLQRELEALWREIEEGWREALQGKGTYDLPTFDDEVSALAAQRTRIEPLVLDVLQRTVTEPPSASAVIATAAELAGAARLESAVPHLIRQLQSSDDFIEEKASQALCQIGGLGVLEGIVAAYREASSGFRLYATNPLSRIHSELAIRSIADFFADEKDYITREFLVQGALIQLTTEGVDLARTLLEEEQGQRDCTELGLRNEAIQTAKVLGYSFPELEQWIAWELAEEKRSEKEQQERAAYWSSMQSRPVPASRPAPAASLRVDAQQPIRREHRVGRNDPCPCGSGKKYKKCHGT